MNESNDRLGKKSECKYMIPKELSYIQMYLIEDFSVLQD